MSTASQFTNPTTNAAIPRRKSQTRTGSARRSRKKVVSRLRPSSSPRTTSRIGRSDGKAAIGGILPHGEAWLAGVEAAHVRAREARDPDRAGEALERQGARARRERVDELPGH